MTLLEVFPSRVCRKTPETWPWGVAHPLLCSTSLVENAKLQRNSELSSIYCIALDIETATGKSVGSLRVHRDPPSWWSMRWVGSGFLVVLDA